MRTYAYTLSIHPEVPIATVLPRAREEFGSAKLVGKNRIRITKKALDINAAEKEFEGLFAAYPVSGIDLEHKPTLIERLLRR